MEVLGSQDLTGTYVATYTVLLQGIIINKESVCMHLQNLYAARASLMPPFSTPRTESRSHPKAAYVNYLQG